jgi:DNA-binding response OmpR family regulator
MSRIQVLFIDDDTSLQTLAKAMLNVSVFEFINANRTAQAEKILGSRHVDIIICDVMMPDEDGLKFCRRLRESGNNTPFLFLSAISDSHSIQQGLDAGASDYLVKPFDIQGLQRKLFTMLGRSPTAPKPKAPEPTKKSQGLLGWLRR